MTMNEHTPKAGSVALSRRSLLAMMAGGALSTLVAPAHAAPKPKVADLAKATEAIQPFKIAIPQDAVDDLKRRLEFVRWPEQETVGDWTQGVPLAKAKALVAHWRDKYDWRRSRRALTLCRNIAP
jgi:hypothetical protein